MKATSTAHAHADEMHETREPASGRRIKAAKSSDAQEDLARSMIDALSDILDYERRCA